MFDVRKVRQELRVSEAGTDATDTKVRQATGLRPAEKYG